MSITIGDTTFDHVDYDAAVDVLYLHVGDPSTAVEFDESPEGHALRFDADGRLIGLTLVGAGQLVAGGSGRVLITTPSQLVVDPADSSTRPCGEVMTTPFYAPAQRGVNLLARQQARPELRGARAASGVQKGCG
jgi:uncharacterized protein YuzE